MNFPELRLSKDISKYKYEYEDTLQVLKNDLVIIKITCLLVDFSINYMTTREAAENRMCDWCQVAVKEAKIIKDKDLRKARLDQLKPIVQEHHKEHKESEALEELVRVFFTNFEKDQKFLAPYFRKGINMIQDIDLNWKEVLIGRIIVLEGLYSSTTNSYKILNSLVPIIRKTILIEFPDLTPLMSLNNIERGKIIQEFMFKHSTTSLDYTHPYFNLFFILNIRQTPLAEVVDLLDYQRNKNNQIKIDIAYLEHSELLSEKHKIIVKQWLDEKYSRLKIKEGMDKPTIPQVAIKYRFLNEFSLHEGINKKNMDEIVKKYGSKSGLRLYNCYNNSTYAMRIKKAKFSVKNLKVAASMLEEYPKIVQKVNDNLKYAYQNNPKDAELDGIEIKSSY